MEFDFLTIVLLSDFRIKPYHNHKKMEAGRARDDWNEHCVHDRLRRLLLARAKAGKRVNKAERSRDAKATTSRAYVLLGRRTWCERSSHTFYRVVDRHVYSRLLRAGG